MRLFSAISALTFPEGSNGTVTDYGVSHAEARAIIADLLGMEVTDLPSYPPERLERPSLDAYLAHWLGRELVQAG
jgi:hypothetical protein